MLSNLKSNIITNLAVENLSQNLGTLNSLICLELIFYQTNLTEFKLEKLILSICKIKNLNKLVINIARNDLNDNALIHFNSVLGNFVFLENLELHVYGNKFSKDIVLDLLDTVSCIGLKTFMLSIKEFVVNQNEQVHEEILDRFNTLNILNKVIC